MPNKIRDVANNVIHSGRRFGINDVKRLATEALDGRGKTSTITKTERKQLEKIYDNNEFTDKGMEAMENLLGFADGQEGVVYPEIERKSLLQILSGDLPFEDPIGDTVDGSESSGGGRSSRNSSSSTPRRRRVAGGE